MVAWHDSPYFQDGWVAVSIKNVPMHLRPREKAHRLGCGSLNDEELLALILKTGTAQHDVLAVAHHLLNHVQGLGGLLHATEKELCEVPGIHRAKAMEILAMLELHRRIARTSIGDAVRIETPAHVYAILHSECRGLKQETLFGLFLNAKRQLIAYKSLFTGTLNGSLVHPRDLFREAIARNSAFVIIAHNHPSGDVTPSLADRQVTKRLMDLGIELAIPVLDHVIIGHDQFYSLVHEKDDEMHPQVPPIVR